MVICIRIMWDTLMAVICSAVGAVALGTSFDASAFCGTSPGVNVFTGIFLTSSCASFDANNLSASVFSY